MQGQRSHLTQAKKCHDKWRADLDSYHMAPNSSFEGCSDGNNQSIGLGERQKVLNVDRNVDTFYLPGPLPDELPNPEEHQEERHCSEERRQEQRCEDHSESPLSHKARWLEYFPHPAGQGIRRAATAFESLRNTQITRGESIWGKFADEGDWDFARWILKSGTTHASTNKLLELKKVS